MKEIYKASPLIMFLIGCLLWYKPNYSKLHSLLGNGLFFSLTTLILALLPAVIIYFVKKKNNQDLLNQEIIDGENSTLVKTPFYPIWSKINLFVGLSLVILLLFTRIYS
jgi:hypothetical protein